MNDQPQKETIGKGDTQRPFKGEVFRDNYEAIFRKPKSFEVECPTPNQEIDEKETKITI